MYSCETWSLKLREEHRLRIVEIRMLRSIYGPKRDEATGGWRTLHDGNFHNLYCSPSVMRMITSRRIRWAEQVGMSVVYWLESQKERDH
jgi:hypothetical protein